MQLFSKSFQTLNFILKIFGFWIFSKSEIQFENFFQKIEVIDINIFISSSAKIYNQKRIFFQALWIICVNQWRHMKQRPLRKASVTDLRVGQRNSHRGSVALCAILAELVLNGSFEPRKFKATVTIGWFRYNLHNEVRLTFQLVLLIIKNVFLF